MTTPDGPGSDIAQLIASLRANAQRYGLTWQITQATVIDGSDPTDVILQFDGDTSVTPGVTSMIGSPRTSRVYVIQVPPAGNYIVGTAGADMYRARLVLAAAASTVTVSDIPLNLRNLRAVWSARSDVAAQNSPITMRVGGDSGINYAFENDQAANVTVTAGPNIATTGGFIGFCSGALSPAGAFGSGTVEFQSWDQAPNGIVRSLGWTWGNQIIGGAVANAVKTNGGGRYSGTAARNSLTLICGAGNFIAGSDFQLVGDLS